MDIKQLALKAYAGLDNIFTDKEAWTLFRAAAFLETFGWLLLIFGITSVKLEWPYADTYLALSGSIHGIFYLTYTFIIIFTHRSMGWSFWRFLVGAALSNAPFGALSFERWVAVRRKNGKW